MSRYEDPGAGERPTAGPKRPGPLGRRLTGGFRAQGRAGGESGDILLDVSGRKRGRRSKRAAGGATGPAGTRGLMSLKVILGTLAVVGTVVVTGVAVSAYVVYRNATDAVNHVNVTTQQLGPRPPVFDGSTNILIIGSDTRGGSHGQYGSASAIQGARSDTILLMHLAPTHTQALVVSFPRDSMVPVYSCPPAGANAPAQQGAPGELEMLNATLNYGAACLWKTLEQSTHIRINHFIEVDFGGFKQIVDDVGGVPVCLPFAIHDPASGLDLTAGEHTVRGYQALAFFRERHVGEGSDLQRIQRQQFFMASVAQKVKSSGILTSPVGLYHLVHDIAASLTTDSMLTTADMYAIANSLKSLSTSGLHFVSVPVLPWSGDPQARVVWQQPLSDQLFTAISHDSHLSRAEHAAKAGSSPTPTPTVSPAQVDLQVLNGSGVPGVADTAATALTSKGFHVVGTGNATNFSYTATVVEYGSSTQLAAADTVQNEVSGAQVKQVSDLPAGSLALILGSSFNGVSSAASGASSSAPATTQSVAAQLGGVSGATNICKDSSAFTGPDMPSMFGP